MKQLANMHTELPTMNETEKTTENSEERRWKSDIPFYKLVPQDVFGTKSIGNSFVNFPPKIWTFCEIYFSIYIVIAKENIKRLLSLEVGKQIIYGLLKMWFALIEFLKTGRANEYLRTKISILSIYLFYLSILSIYSIYLF